MKFFGDLINYNVVLLKFNKEIGIKVLVILSWGRGSIGGRGRNWVRGKRGKRGLCLDFI